MPLAACCLDLRPMSPRRVTQEEWDRRAEAQGLRWLDAVKGADIKTQAACLTCGYEWDGLPANVARGSGCPQCARRLSQDEWDQRAQAQGLRWLDEVKGAHVKTPATCLTCGYGWEVTPDHVANGTGCPACAEYGFDPEKPALLYLVERPEGIGKVGITNGIEVTETKRFDDLGKQAYSLVKAWSSEDGHKIAALERAVLSWWRNDLGLPPALTEGDGFTETVALNEVSVPEIVEFVEQEIRALGIEAVPIVEVED